MNIHYKLQALLCPTLFCAPNLVGLRAMVDADGNHHRPLMTGDRR